MRDLLIKILKEADGAAEFQDIVEDITINVSRTLWQMKMQGLIEVDGTVITFTPEKEMSTMARKDFKG